MSFSEAELAYYARHLSLETVGIEGQKKLKNARVLCVGAGGLGCPLLIYLAAAGVGTLGVIDHDPIEITNLHRQILYTPDDLGLLKAETACKKLSHLNPYIQAVAYPFQLTTENVFEIISSYDIVADCTDNFSARYLINDACFYLNKPNVQASISQFSGQCSIFTAQNGPCYRCIFDSPPSSNSTPNCAEAGVIGVLPGILGSLQALEVIKLIVGIGTPLIGNLLMFNSLSMTFKTFAIQKNPACRLCQHQQPFASLPKISAQCTNTLFDEHSTKLTPKALKQLQQQEEVFILDVREPYEYEICNMGGYLIPLAELPRRLNELDPQQKIVVHCKKDSRSQIAAAILKDSGFTEVFYLAGGILAWKEEVAPELAGY